jgi:SAM-dependent methyltransferase
MHLRSRRSRMKIQRTEDVARGKESEVTFSFGKNWQRFVKELHPRSIEAMASYFERWLPQPITGHTFLDIGSGSGLSSLVAFQKGARVTSFDLDPRSVDATGSLRALAGAPDDWSVLQGSILDAAFVEGLGVFDIVLAWGVLHHTGDLWRAVRSSADRVGPGGLLWIAVYRKGYRSGRSLRLKQRYNRTPDALKPAFRLLYASPRLAYMALKRDFSELSHSHQERGMDWWRDLEDWLGGLPYEVASPAEVHDTLRPLGFALERMEIGEGDGGNDIYMYRRAD